MYTWGRTVTKALIGGGGGAYSYIRVLPDEFLLKSTVMTTDFKRNLSGKTRIYEYPPPPPINALVTALTGGALPFILLLRKVRFRREGDNDDLESSETVEYEALTKQYFETNECVSVNVEDVPLCLSDFSHQLSHFPTDFDVKSLLAIENNSVSLLSESM